MLVRNSSLGFVHFVRRAGVGDGRARTTTQDAPRGVGTMRSPFGLYVRRWAAWATAGLAPGSIDVAGADTIAA